MNNFPKNYYLNLFLDITSILVLLCFVFISLFGLSSQQNLFGYSSYVVQSGSMEPTISTGDVILVKKESAYNIKDVVTFLDSSQRTVTHRLISLDNTNNQSLYTTKGDANRTKDNDLINANQIVGKVDFVIPRLGFLVVFSRTFAGLLIFVLIPGLLIVVKEIYTRYANPNPKKSLLA